MPPLAAMMASFVILVRVPRVIVSPGVHPEWIMVDIASTLTGAAWLIRKYAS